VSRTQSAYAIEYAKFFSRSHDAVIHVFDAAGNVIETHDQAGEFKEWYVFTRIASRFPLKAISNDSAFIGSPRGKQAD